MVVRRLPLFVLVAAWLVASASPAVAGPRADIEKRLAAAMESYDLLEYETARKLLASALEIAKDGRFEDDPVVARVHLSMGIVYFAGLGDKAAARRSFIDAVTIDPKISLDPAYKTPDMSTLLETVRAATVANLPERRKPVPGEDDRRGDAGSSPDCLTISGLKHALIDHARSGGPQRVTASLGGDIQASKVALFARAVTAAPFQEFRMSRDRDCTYVGTIPANLFNGDTVYYYVAAVNAAGTVVASSGSAGAPNLIEVGEDVDPPRRRSDGAEPQFADPVDDRPPLEPDGRVSKGATATARRKMMASVGAASGVGYVTGETEQLHNKVQCCIAPGFFTLMAEVGYGVSPRLVVSAAARLGFPLGANVEGHSPLGPAGFVRFRYALSPKRSAAYVMGELGGGLIRNTVKLRAVSGDMDTDIVALGPLLAGGGMGYSMGLSDNLQLLFDLSAVAGIPVVGELGGSALNFGIQVDATVGAAVRF
jgi:hypothetical protein